MKNIIELKGEITLGIQTFPVGFKLNTKLLTKEMKNQLKKIIKNAPQLFHGDVDDMISVKEVKGKLPTDEKGILALGSNELKFFAKQEGISSWHRCKDETLKARLIALVEKAEKKEEVAKKENSAKNSSKLEIINENEKIVEVKATEEMIKKMDLVGKIEVGDPLELTKEEFKEWQ